MKIEPNGLCKIPASYEEVTDFIAALPERERANATLVMLLTHNFLASVVNDDQAQQN